MLKDLQIGVVVTGSIAAYKGAELVRELMKRGSIVRVAMTRSACEFVTPLTFQTLTGEPVATELFDLTQESEIGHIRFADECDVLVVAPATANIVAKMAHGIADDLATTVLLATRAPIVVAPAMNVNMWEHPATQANLSTLISRGVRIVEPGVGELACGWEGAGRFAELGRIVEEIEESVSKPDLKGCRVIVTAGPTQEPIDPVRFVSNHSSGKMGYAVARAAMRRGAEVTLITGPTQIAPPQVSKLISVKTSNEMSDALNAAIDRLGRNPSGARDMLFKVAAVSDFAPMEEAETKIKREKDSEFTLKMKVNPDILKAIGEGRESLKQRGIELTVVGFAAESAGGEELIRFARDKIARKRVDLIVANDIGDAMGTDTNRVVMVDAAGNQEVVEVGEKLYVADRIIDAALKI